MVSTGTRLEICVTKMAGIVLINRKSNNIQSPQCILYRIFVYDHNVES